MSLGDIFFGPSAEFGSATPAEQRLSAQLPSLSRASAGLGRAEDLFLQDLARGRPNQRNRAVNAAAIDANMAISGRRATNQGGALENALNRGRGLSRVVSSVGNAFDTQTLRDRVAVARHMRQRRGEGIRGLMAAAGIQSDLQDALSANERMRAGATSNLLGTATGAGLAFFNDRRMSNQAFRTQAGAANQGIVTEPFNPGVMVG